MPDTPSPEQLGLWGTGIAAVTVLLTRLGTVIEAIRGLFGSNKRRRSVTPDPEHDAATLHFLGLIAGRLEAIAEDSKQQTGLIRELRDEAAESHKAQLALQELQGKDLHMLSKALRQVVDGKSDHVHLTPLGQFSTHRD